MLRHVGLRGYQTKQTLFSAIRNVLVHSGCHRTAGSLPPENCTAGQCYFLSYGSRAGTKRQPSSRPVLLVRRLVSLENKVEGGRLAHQFASRLATFVVHLRICGRNLYSKGSGTIIDADGTILTAASLFRDQKNPEETKDFYVGLNTELQITVSFWKGGGGKYRGVLQYIDFLNGVAVVKIEPDFPLAPAKLGTTKDLPQSSMLLGIGRKMACPLDDAPNYVATEGFYIRNKSLGAKTQNKRTLVFTGKYMHMPPIFNLGFPHFSFCFFSALFTCDLERFFIYLFLYFMVCFSIGLGIFIFIFIFFGKNLALCFFIYRDHPDDLPPSRFKGSFGNLMRMTKGARGSYGGPVFSLMKKEVVGIIANYNEIISVDVASKVLDHFKKHGRVIQPYLGVTIQGFPIGNDIYPDVGKYVLVVKVNPGSPADRAGLLPGDVVVDFDGATIGSFGEFNEVMWDKVGEPLQMTVKGKEGETKKLTVIPEETTLDTYDREFYIEFGDPDFPDNI